MALSTLLWRSESANPAVMANEQVELAIGDLQAIETFLNAIEHYSAGLQEEPDVHQVTHQALVLLHYAQERVRRARHRLDTCLPASR